MSIPHNSTLVGGEGLAMRFEDLPGRVFLDTCVVNFILDHGEEIHDGVAPPGDAPERVIRDIDALYNVFLRGQRAQWQLAISPHTYQQVVGTQEPRRRRHLETWFLEIWRYWRDVIDRNDHLPSFIEPENLRLHLLASGTPVTAGVGAVSPTNSRTSTCKKSVAAAANKES